MEQRILDLLGQKDYIPANVPELLRLLRLPPNHQQELQAVLQKLEQAGDVARVKGNRWNTHPRWGTRARRLTH